MILSSQWRHKLHVHVKMLIARLGFRKWMKFVRTQGISMFSCKKPSKMTALHIWNLSDNLILRKIEKILKLVPRSPAPHHPCGGGQVAKDPVPGQRCAGGGYGGGPRRRQREPMSSANYESSPSQILSSLQTVLSVSLPVSEAGSPPGVISCP